MTHSTHLTFTPRLTTALLILILGLSACGNKGTKKDASHAEQQNPSTQQDTKAATPSKLAQPDWQKAPPGMPEEAP